MKTNVSFTNQSRKQLRKLLALWLGPLLLCLATARSPAQTYKILHTFGTNVMGQYPVSTMVQGPDGALYGTTEQGGGANLGQVFKVNPDGTGYMPLKDFTDSDGAYPEAGLVWMAQPCMGRQPMAVPTTPAPCSRSIRTALGSPCSSDLR